MFPEHIIPEHISADKKAREGGKIKTRIYENAMCVPIRSAEPEDDLVPVVLGGGHFPDLCVFP